MKKQSPMKETIQMRMRVQTRNALAELGKKDDTFDALVTRLIEYYTTNRRKK